MKPTIKDVAKLAGVSFKTVSRVINSEPSVDNSLRDKVKDAIKQLNYRPNLSARHLRGAGAFVGFIYDNPNSHYIVEMQKGILDECRRCGYELVIHPCNSKSPELINEVIDLVDNGSLAGLILAPPLSEDGKFVKELFKHKTHFVRVVSGSEPPHDVSAPCIHVDDNAAAFELVNYLISLGHKRIAFLSGDPEHSSSGERERGYLQALEQVGLEVDQNLIIPGTYSFGSGVTRTQSLLSSDSPPTAIVGCNDEIAAGSVFAARLGGLQVPDDISVAGFEDSPFSRQSAPPLTTVHQSNSEIAKSAAAHLIGCLKVMRSGEKPEVEAETKYCPQLVVRESVAPPKNKAS